MGCGEREFYGSFMKRSRVFMLVISGGIIPYANCSGKKNAIAFIRQLGAIYCP